MFPRDSQRTVRQRDQDCDVGTGESILVCDSGESFLLRPEELAISGVWQGAYFLQLLRGGRAMIGCIFPQSISIATCSRQVPLSLSGF